MTLLKIMTQKDRAKQLSITHSLNGMTYYGAGDSLGATLAFQDIQSWRMEPHQVSFVASIMKQQSKNALPTSTFWQIHAKVNQLDTERNPSKIKLFNFLSEAEAITYLRVFQQEPLRQQDFHKEYFNDGRAPKDIYVPLKTQLNCYGKKDPYNKESMRLRDRESLSLPIVMMTEEVFAAKEYKAPAPKKDGEDLDMMDYLSEENLYKPYENLDKKRLFHNLSKEWVKAIEDSLEEMQYPVQLVAFLTRGVAEHVLMSDHIMPDTPVDLDENTMVVSIYVMQGEQFPMTSLGVTSNFDTAYQIFENYDRAVIQPNLAKVSAHQAVRSSYDNHYTRYKSSIHKVNRFMKNIYPS